VTWSYPQSGNERQQSLNDFVCWISCNWTAVLRLVSIIEVLVICIGKIVNVDVPSPDNERQHSVNIVSTECQQSFNRASTECQQTVNRASTEHQQSINNLGCCILYDSRAVLRHLPRINALAVFVGQIESDMVVVPIWKLVSTEHQRLRVWHHVSSNGCSTAVIRNRRIVRLYRQYG